MSIAVVADSLLAHLWYVSSRSGSCDELNEQQRTLAHYTRLYHRSISTRWWCSILYTQNNTNNNNDIKLWRHVKQGTEHLPRAPQHSFTMNSSVILYISRTLCLATATACCHYWWCLDIIITHYYIFLDIALEVGGSRLRFYRRHTPNLRLKTMTMATTTLVSMNERNDLMNEWNKLRTWEEQRVVTAGGRPSNSLNMCQQCASFTIRCWNVVAKNFLKYFSINYK